MCLVEVIGPNRFIKGGIYIRYRTGGTDTTKAHFLFDVPVGLVEVPLTPEEVEPRNDLSELLGEVQQQKEFNRVNSSRGGKL